MIQRVALAAVLGVGVLSSLAGEAIIIPGEKNKTAPAANPAASPREVFRLRDSYGGSPGALPFDALTVPLFPEKKKLDPKEEKRQRLQQLEEKNWMVVDKGELQAEEEEKNFLNVREYSLDAIEKRDDTGNLMFRPLSKDDTRRMPGQFRSADNARQPGQRASEEEPDGRGFSRYDKDPQVGAHMSSELNFKGMFEPRQSGSDSLAPKFNKSELTLHSLLNSGSSAEATRDQQARRDEFRSFLNKPSSATPLGGPSDPINARSDFTRQPLNPTMPLGGSSVGRREAFGSAPNVSRSGSSFSPGLPTVNSPRPSPGFAAGSLLSPDSARSGQRTPINFDPPKRKF